ncbi:MAG: hypothetical protein AB7K09_14540 [Planctomycetota bacterium]
MSYVYRPASVSFWPYVFRTITRARMRSLLTVVGVAVSMALFAFVRSMDEGMTRLQASINQSDMLIVFERNTF